MRYHMQGRLANKTGKPLSPKKNRKKPQLKNWKSRVVWNDVDNILKKDQKPLSIGNWDHKSEINSSIAKNKLIAMETFEL